MRRYALFIMMVCLSSACVNEDLKLVSEEKMSVIMTDLMLADYTLRQYPVGMRDSLKGELMKSLLKVHKLTEAELDTNLYHYSVDYEKYQHLLEVVEVRLDSLSEATSSSTSTKTSLPSKLNK